MHSAVSRFFELNFSYRTTSNPKKMTEYKKLILCLDEKITDGKHIFNSRLHPERFQQYILEVHETDFGNPTKEKEPPEISWKGKENKIQKDLHRTAGPEAKSVQQKNWYKYWTEPWKMKIDNLLSLFRRNYLTKESKYNVKGGFFNANQTDMERLTITGKSQKL